MTQLVPFHKTCDTTDFTPYAETYQQVVPKVGLVFSLRDNGFGSGGARAFVITEVSRKRNRYDLPTSFVAKELHKTFHPEKPRVAGEYDNGTYTVDEEKKECLVDKSSWKTFQFRRRDGEAYYFDRLSYIRWGEVIVSDLFDK